MDFNYNGVEVSPRSMVHEIPTRTSFTYCILLTSLFGADLLQFRFGGEGDGERR